MSRNAPAQPPRRARPDAASGLAAANDTGRFESALATAARSWPGPALAIGADGAILSASPLSGYAEGMRPPFEISNPKAHQVTDAAGRTWRVSAPVEGVRFASADVKEGPDAAHRFTAAVSHEIRTPLNGILGMAALLEEGELAPAQRDYAAAIRKSGARLLDLLNNVLDYSRLEAGDVPLDISAFDPADLVQDVAELLAPRAHAAGLDIAAVCDPGLPASLMGDTGRLRQILFNLAGNAVKFTDAGAVLIEARRRPDGSGLRLMVRDTGAGIPESARARLFEAFGQANAADAGRDGGVGLGLAIVARLVSAMKGEVDFSSAPGEGSIFFVDLPLADAPHAAKVADAKRPRRAPTISLALPPASAIACAMALSRDGSRAIAGEGAADLALVDAALPPARIEAMAKRRPTLVVLRPEDRSRIAAFRELGCVGYLIRPLRAASIVDRVRHALAGAEVEEPVAEQVAPGAAGRALIADDNAVNALLARRTLEAAGFRVDTAGTGAEALEAAGETLYSVIFMDIRMPVMDGLEATRRIRRLAGQAGATPIVALTADIDPVLEDRAREAGVSAMAAKPIDPERLRKLAQTWAAEVEDRRVGPPERRGLT
jgi:signal transduction histidine kinase/CheY-like chemotaxis protein